jgi:ribosome-binding factor A
MSVRQRKVASLIQETLGSIFLEKIRDPELGLVTITDVKVTPDLKIAKIYISVYQKDKREYALEHIESMKGVLRSELAHRVNLRSTPELKFFIDDTYDYIEKIDKIFENIKNDNHEKE